MVAHYGVLDQALAK